MKLLWSSALAVAFATTALAPVLAGGHGSKSCDCCAPAPVCDEAPKTVKKTFYEVKSQKKEITIVEETVVPIEKVIQEKVCEMVPTWTEQKKMVTTTRKVPKVIEKEVASCHLVAECVTDPCTGCTKTCYKPTTVVKKVQCTVYETVCEQHEVTEKVCKMVSVEKIVERRVSCGLQCVDVKKKEMVTVLSLVPITVEQPAPPVVKPCCEPHGYGGAPCCK